MLKTKLAAILLATSVLSGCAAVDTVKKYWPRSHDPMMFNQLVQLDIVIEKQNCDAPAWSSVTLLSENLARYVEWRQDPQAENIRGLHNHIERLSKGGSKTFCELGKKTAKQRIEAAKSAWEGR